MLVFDGAPLPAKSVTEGARRQALAGMVFRVWRWRVWGIKGLNNSNDGESNVRGADNEDEAGVA